MIRSDMTRTTSWAGVTTVALALAPVHGFLAGLGGSVARIDRTSLYAAPKKPTFQSQWMDNKEEVGPRGMEVSELPDSFEDALNIAVECTRSAFETGNNRVRVDFDTTAGDQTYTTLKNSLPLARTFAEAMGKMVMEQSAPAGEAAEGAVGEAAPKPYEGNTVAVFFPDTGSAVWVDQDWKVGQLGSKVPPSVRCASFPNEGLLPTDTAFLIVCPRASESAATFDLVTSIPADLPVVLINPELIDAGVVGFGMAGRRIRDEIEAKFERSYYLKTLDWGALTRRWPRGYSVWEEDENLEEGYKLLKTVGTFPTSDDIDDIRMEAAEGDTKGPSFADGLAKFIDQFRRI